MTRRKYILLIVSNIVGIMVSIYSLILTEKINNYLIKNELVCDINKTFSCSTTYISKYSFIFNIPVALFALLFFWFILFFLLLNRKRATHESSYQMLGLLNAVALIICACFLYVLIFILRNICLSCLFIDFIVAMNFFLLFNSFIKTFNTPKIGFTQFFVSNWLFLFSILLLFSSGLVLYKVYRSGLKKKNKELMEEFYTQKPIVEIACKNSVVWGNEKGKVKIRIFNDFRCGYCKMASEKYRELFRNDSSVKIEFICYPLNYEKNRKQGSKNINIFLAKAMLAASHQKEYWKFHDLTIKQSDNLDSAKVFDIAFKVLDNFENFKNDFFTNNYDSILIGNIKLAQEYKVSGTPAIFINGREFQQWTNISLLKMIVEKDAYNGP